MQKLFKTKITIAVFLVLSILVIGVFGFKFFAGYNWTDALYMTIITVSSVGYGEVHPLSFSGKLFAVFLIITSVGTLGFAISVISETILSPSNYELLKKRRVQKKIDKLDKHVIVVGYGRNGKQAVQKLMSYGRSFVVVERDEAIIEKSQDPDVLFVHGDANEDEVLRSAGVERASTLIAALPKDSANLFTVLTARQINKDMKIISRASEESTTQKLKFAGADNVILPDKIGGDHMASLVVTPDLVEFLDQIKVSGDGRVNVYEITYEAVSPDNKERTIRDIDLRNKTGCSIIGYKTPSGNYTINPDASTIIEKDSKLIVLGRPIQIEKLHKEFAI